MIKAWKITLTVDGEQANDTQYVPMQSGLGWDGGEKAFLETVAHLTRFEMWALAQPVSGKAQVSLNVEVVDLDPDQIT